MDSQKLAAVRNRENQRRSRARRRDYIHELEVRIRQYESAGVRATAEIQAAARKVAEENIRLRSLLGAHGVEGRRLEELLEQGNPAFAPKPSWTEQPKTSPYAIRSAPVQANDALLGHGISSPTATAEEATAEILEPAARSLVSPIVQSLTPIRDENSEAQSAFYDHDVEPYCCKAQARAESPQSSFPGLPSSPATQDFGLDDDRHLEIPGAGDEISCVAAAEIIASMRGHISPEDVFDELGCKSSKSCMVKRMAIFQVMDTG